MDRDSWFVTRWVRGHTITICNKITEILFLTNVYLNLTLERPLTLADKGTSHATAHDRQTQDATLATFVASIVANIFFIRHGNQNGRSLEHCNYSKHILLVPWSFVISRFHCTSLVPVTSQPYSRWPGFYAIGKDSRLPDGTSLKSEFVLQVGFLVCAQEEEHSTISVGFF